jgi:NAD(P)-dependent dehydrogenase (short-subunit alcohol dehydrogenase family)
MKRLEGKVALITGGNSGIGLATAECFAAEGARVIITARRQAVLDQAVRRIGHGACGLVGDVADLSHHASVAAWVKEKYGRLDVYMANAGVLTLSPSSAVTPVQYDEQFNTNARGVFFGVQAMAPLMDEGGSIILTSSLAASRALQGHAVYAGSKAAIEAFARHWALELCERKVRVNVISPGPVDTGIVDKLGVAEADRPAFVKAMTDAIPAGRFGYPSEVAQAAVYLASDESLFVNGARLSVDGGMSMA